MSHSEPTSQNGGKHGQGSDASRQVAVGSQVSENTCEENCTTKKEKTIMEELNIPQLYKCQDSESSDDDSEGLTVYSDRSSNRNEVLMKAHDMGQDLMRKVFSESRKMIESEILNK